jgi:hypothetical protein
MKKLTRDRVVPIISASVSWLIFAMTGSGRRIALRVHYLILPILGHGVPAVHFRKKRFGVERGP